jgi:DNA adenine methylase
VGKTAISDEVDPLPGIAPWVGGKRNLAKRITAKIAAIPHVCYAEPFVGMGGVFFKRQRRAQVEVIND